MKTGPIMDGDVIRLDVKKNFRFGPRTRSKSKFM
jgi:hypothetical protein